MTQKLTEVERINSLNSSKLQEQAGLITKLSASLNEQRKPTSNNPPKY